MCPRKITQYSDLPWQVVNDRYRVHFFVKLGPELILVGSGFLGHMLILGDVHDLSHLNDTIALTEDLSQWSAFFANKYIFSKFHCA